MTGYGKNVVQAENSKVSVEIRTLNSKQLDINLRLPHILKDKEIEIRKEVGILLQRGKIDVSIVIEKSDIESASVIDVELAKHYYKELRSLAKSVNQDNNKIKIKDYYQQIKMPEVLIQKEIDVNESEVDSVFKCLKDALSCVDKFRTEEGQVLTKDFVLRVNKIKELLTQVDQFEKSRIENIKERITGNIKKFMQDPSIDNNRLEQEMIYYIEKLDITEEKVRLLNNCNYFLETLDNAESSGKKLGFITQEIGREINTLGSKANNSDLQKIVVLMKDELEKIKEQLFNIL